MRPIRIFISSVQSEFAEERARLSKYILSDVLLGRFFQPFIFEELPAVNNTPQQTYLQEVGHCDIYLGLLGALYGYEDQQGVSPTQREYDEATAQNKHRLIFIKDLDRTSVHPKEAAFVTRVESSVVRKSFGDYEQLQSAVYAALIRYLEEKEFIRLLPFDATFHPTASLNDIDEEKVAHFVRLANAARKFPIPFSAGIPAILTHLDLMAEDTRLTNAALLLFAQKPQSFFITSEVKCAQFYGYTITKPIRTLQVYRGSVFQLIDQAVDFVMSRIDARVGTRDKKTDVDIDYELPLGAVREAIVNAVTHRDYTSNGSVQVMLFKDRLEIWNPGTLPYGLTPEKLLKPHPSLPTNPMLANPIYLSGYIERIGTGTEDIVNKCREFGLRDPEYIQEENFRTILWRPEKKDDAFSSTVGDRSNGRSNQSQDTDIQYNKIYAYIDGRLNGRLNDTIKNMVKVINEHPGLDTNKISALTQVSIRTTGRYLKQLKDNSLIEFIGPKKTGGYYLTSEGKSLL